MAWGYRSLLSRTRSTKVCEKEDESCVVNVCRAGGRTTSYTIQTAEHQGLVYVIGYCLTLNQLYSSAVWAVGRSLRERSNQYMGTLALMSPPSLPSFLTWASLQEYLLAKPWLADCMHAQMGRYMQEKWHLRLCEQSCCLWMEYSHRICRKKMSHQAWHSDVRSQMDQEGPFQFLVCEDEPPV